MWYAIILAGGSGSRMGAGQNKVLMDLCGEKVLMRSIRAFEGLVHGIVIAARAQDMEEISHLLVDSDRNITLVTGGNTRQASVWNALCALPAHCDKVLIHDGARCLVDRETILRCMSAAADCGTGIAAIPVVDTIKQINADDTVCATPDRNSLRAVQTPQAFDVSLIRRAHVSAIEQGFIGTDDASLVERIGVPVRLTLGDRKNIKLTTPEDIRMAEAFLTDRFPSFRVGQGYDVHRLVEGRDLILCGVKVPHTLGLLGHSDADVALHALMDAMLGAMALGDIGKHFPDTDARYKGISSMLLLKHVCNLLDEKDARVTNCDVTIAAQKPKLLPYIDQMRKNVADMLSLSIDCVNVKATTTEHLGFEGREEGISARAICIVAQK